MKRLSITALVSLIVGLVLGVVAGRKMPPTREQVMTYLNNLSVGEYSDFAKRLNSHWGFQALPQQLLPAPVAPEPGK
jgi:hypothetical protein